MVSHFKIDGSPSSSLNKGPETFSRPIEESRKVGLNVGSSV